MQAEVVVPVDATTQADATTQTEESPDEQRFTYLLSVIQAMQYQIMAIQNYINKK